MGNKLQVSIMALFAFLVPTLSLFLPHSIAGIFTLVSLYPFYMFIKQGHYKNIWHGCNLNKIIIIFFAYSLISIIWAIKPSQSISLWIKLLLFFISAISLFSFLKTIKDKDKILKSLLCGLLLALIIANIEIYTNGFISNIFGLVYKGSSHFDIVLFNRGASIISIMCWPAIAYLCMNKHYKSAAILYALVFITILQMLSLSSTLGFLTGAAIFPLILFRKKKALKMLAILSVISVFTVAATAKIIDAHKLVGHVPVVPGGASDIRLYIWDYAAEQAYKKPVLGWGLNASRSYPVSPSDYVMGGRHPLPLHPHNNTLQIWLELGGVGLIIFAAFLYLTFTGIGNNENNPIMIGLSTSLFINYLTIGQIGYGIWQSWWLASVILAFAFFKLNTASKEKYL